MLIIAYIFPPLGGSGVQRTLKFVKYLPAFGWRPLVVCGDDPEVFRTGLDETLLDEVPPEARVWRTRFASPLGLRRRAQQRLGIAGAGVCSEAANGADAHGGGRPALRRLLGALSRPLAPLEFPPVDAALYWALSIVPLCRKILAEEQVDLILTTSFPYSDHVTGLLLRRLTGTPWVADFRDPWTQNAFAANRGWRCRADRWAERRVLRRADRVVGVTPTYTAGLRSLAPGRPGGDFVTVENGFDAADFDGASPGTAHGDVPTTLAHVGMVYDGSALPVLEALARLGPEGSHLEVRFVGGVAASEEMWLREHRLAAQVMVEPRLPHIGAIEAMHAADALLLLVGDGPGWVGHYPGKLFEYMASGRPILAVGAEGDAAELVRASGTGCAVPAADGEAIAGALRLLSTQPDEFRRRYYRPRPEVVARYERRALAERLAAVLDEVVGEKGSIGEGLGHPPALRGQGPSPSGSIGTEE